MALTANGLTTPTLTELLTALKGSAQAEFGVNIEVSTDSILGHLLGIYASELDLQYSEVKALYDNLNIDTSVGRNLDDLAFYSGTIRQDATTKAKITFTGTSGTVIPSGTRVQVTGVVQQEFQTLTTVSIPVLGTVETEAEASGTFIADSGKINVMPVTIVGVTANNLASSYTGRAIETDTEFRHRCLTNLSVGGNGTLSAIQSSIQQIVGVTTALVVENDTWDLVPRDTSPFTHTFVIGDWVAATGTTSTITVTAGTHNKTLPSIQVLKGLEEVYVNESIDNITKDVIITVPTDADKFDGSIVFLEEPRPRKSFEVIVEGGADLDIVNTIVNTKAGGIQAFGSTVLTTTDISGIQHLVGFTRPTTRPISININYTLYSEEIFPTTGENDIREAVLAFTDIEYVLGREVLPHRLYTPVNTIPGIGSLNITVAYGTSPVEYIDGQLSIQLFERATLAKANIAVNRV